ncbi:hypothetical protein SAMN04489841_3600 [Natrinema salaciae]|uniref:Uncharacterized protein n=1 Tax=Natrinema salaciae TaxID=1186196 RepID=A0A1H9NH56_9EURY|nr:hypothetical protein SAMN04489841_3600 [Natrinema salaciae]
MTVPAPAKALESPSERERSDASRSATRTRRRTHSEPSTSSFSTRRPPTSDSSGVDPRPPRGAARSSVPPSAAVVSTPETRTTVISSVFVVRRAEDPSLGQLVEHPLGIPALAEHQWYRSRDATTDTARRRIDDTWETWTASRSRGSGAVPLVVSVDESSGDPETPTLRCRSRSTASASDIWTGRTVITVVDAPTDELPVRSRDGNQFVRSCRRSVASRSAARKTYVVM